jgi:hypothetical protein
MNPTEKMEMQVAERDDGTAMVAGLPEDTAPAVVEKPPTIGVPENSDDGQEDGTEDEDDLLEQKRAARREERRLKKQLHREKAKESTHHIEVLRRQNQELADQVARLSERTSGAEMARVDKAIEDAQVKVQYAMMKISQATEARDGQAMARAQQDWYESKRELESLEHGKSLAVKQLSQPPRSNVVPANETVQEYIRQWTNRNSWFNPQRGDVDSQIVKLIDAEVAKEGYDPASQEYWDELDDRLEERLPHRYTKRDNDAEITAANTTTNRRRSAVTGTGRDNAPTGKPGQYEISAERVRAMKDSGAWEDSVRKKRMIEYYMKHDRENKEVK